MKAMKKGIAVGMIAIGIAVVGCSSSSSGGALGNSGGACAVSENAKVTTVTSKSSDMQCPALTPAQFNTDSDGGDGGACTSVEDRVACKLTLTCDATDEDGVNVKGGGTFIGAGKSATGDLVINITPPGEAAVRCTYALVIQ